MRRPRKGQCTVWLDNPLMPLYAYLAAVGILVLAGGPSGAVAQNTPLWLTYAWACSLAAAGLLTMAGCATDRNRMEAAGLALLLFGLGLTALADATSDGLGTDDALAISTLAGCAWLRLRILRKARRAVKQVHHALCAGGGPHG